MTQTLKQIKFKDIVDKYKEATDLSNAFLKDSLVLDEYDTIQTEYTDLQTAISKWLLFVKGKMKPSEPDEIDDKDPDSDPIPRVESQNADDDITS